MEEEEKEEKEEKRRDDRMKGGTEGMTSKDSIGITGLRDEFKGQ